MVQHRAKRCECKTRTADFRSSEDSPNNARQRRIHVKITPWSISKLGSPQFPTPFHVDKSERFAKVAYEHVKQDQWHSIWLQLLAWPSNHLLPHQVVLACIRAFTNVILVLQLCELTDTEVWPRMVSCAYNSTAVHTNT